MYPSIPVSEFVKPERGTSAFNAVARALQNEPDVIPVGTFGNERWYRVQQNGSQAHCVIVNDEEATCNCMAHHRPQSPLACLHIAAALISEANNGRSRT